MYNKSALNISDLHAEIARLNKVVNALMDRVESSTNNWGSDFNLFQSEITLEDQVRRRTSELQAALRKNEKITRALRERESHNRLLVENSPICILEIDVGGRITSMNRAGLDMLWLKDECDVQGSQYMDAFSSAEPDKVGDMLVKARAGEACRLEFKSKGLRRQIFKSSFVPIKNKSGIVEKLMGITEDITKHHKAEELLLKSLEDITERKRAEAALSKVQLLLNETELKAKNIAIQTASAIAHEINQPLLSIATYSDAALMLMKCASPDQGKIVKAIEGSRKQAHRAGRSIRELLEFLNVKEFSRETFDLNQELDSILHSLKLDFEDAINLTLKQDAKVAMVSANRSHFKKVILNLINNGLDAMQEAGVPSPELTVTVTPRNDVCVAQISIQDNGPGIKQEFFSRLFEPFFTTKNDGIGMGLAISRSLIEENGGQLWIDPQAAPGATFHLTLPFAV